MSTRYPKSALNSPDTYWMPRSITGLAVFDKHFFLYLPSPAIPSLPRSLARVRALSSASLSLTRSPSPSRARSLSFTHCPALNHSHVLLPSAVQISSKALERKQLQIVISCTFPPCVRGAWAGCVHSARVCDARMRMNVCVRASARMKVYVMCVCARTCERMM